MALILPLVISSIAHFPLELNVDETRAHSLPQFSIKPIDDILPGNNDYFDCTSFGPFSLDTVTNDVSVSFTYELYSVSSQNFIERVRLLNSSNSVVASSSKAFFYYVQGDHKTVTFTLPIRDHLTRSGLTLKFE